MPADSTNAQLSHLVALISLMARLVLCIAQKVGVDGTELANAVIAHNELLHGAPQTASSSSSAPQGPRADPRAALRTQATEPGADGEQSQYGWPASDASPASTPRSSSNEVPHPPAEAADAVVFATSGCLQRQSGRFHNVQQCTGLRSAKTNIVAISRGAIPRFLTECAYCSRP